MGFIIRWIVTAVAVAAAVWLVPGIDVIGQNSVVAVVALALILSLVNLSIKPILQILSLPISILTLGFFYLVVNALVLELAAWMTAGLFDTGIVIDGFGSAFLGSLVISLVSILVNGIVGNDA